MNNHADWCMGCAENDPRDRVYLPYNYKPGDPIPDNVTRHGTPRERIWGQAPFAIVGGPHGRRVKV